MTVVSDPAKALAKAQELSVLLAEGAIEPEKGCTFIPRKVFEISAAEGSGFWSDNCCCFSTWDLVPSRRSPLGGPLTQVPSWRSPHAGPLLEVPSRRSPSGGPFTQVPSWRSPHAGPLVEVPSRRSPRGGPLTQVP
ncbi:hypothetical protein NQZ68_011156 [Dissostichus eleginoides]|nr:hypothetical protein NQZ68_011156 [Dissostichus eleginoides]